MQRLERSALRGRSRMRNYSEAVRETRAPSLRAQRSNPHFLSSRGKMDCFAALAMTSATVIARHRVGALRRPMTGSGGQSSIPETPMMESKSRLQIPAPLAVRKLDHGLAGRHLLIVLIAHHDVDQDPARIRRRLFRLDDAGGLDGVARPDRLDPPGFEAAMNGAGGIGPVGDHPRDQPEIVHAVHDDAAETGLAEIALHVLVVEMQRVVVERGVAEQADGFAADRKFRTVDRIAGLQIFKRGAHDRALLTSAGWSGRDRNRSLRHAG